MCDNSCYFEPTDTLNGILILPYRCQASGFRPYAVEGRSMVAVTHLALLGVKIQDSAFWAIQKKKQSHYAAAFAMGGRFENNFDKEIRKRQG